MAPRYLTTLVEILRSTLHLIDYYEGHSSGLKSLEEARGCIRRAIEELESSLAPGNEVAPDAG